ncbi:MAG: hypothetical protein EON55_17825, partial [Alphaproteobacteria bacterium]
CVPDGLEAQSARRARATLRQLDDSLALDDAFHAAGVPLLFLKGVTLAARLNRGRLGLRPSVDIDVAVAECHVEHAWEILKSLGYRTISPGRPLSPSASRLFRWASKDSVHQRPGAPHAVELHWRLSDDLADPSPPPARLWRRQVVAPGRSLAMLPDETLFVYLCTHGAVHCWARLKWLADVVALVEESHDRGAEYWLAARRQGAAVPAASALLLAHRLCGLPLPPGFMRPRSLRLRLLEAVSLRIVTAQGGAFDLGAARMGGWAEFAAKILVAPNLISCARLLRSMLISADDVGRVPLPPWAAVLYPLLRLPLLLMRRRRRFSASRTPSGPS